MVRPELVRAFDDACFVVVQEEVAELTQRTLPSVASTHNAHGMTFSSAHLMSIDSAAAKACKQTAERLYGHLIDLLGAERPDGSNEKAEELASLLVEKIDSAGREISLQRDGAMARWSKPLGVNWSEQLRQMPEALNNARMMFASKVRTAVLGSVHRGSYAMASTVTVHGPVGSVQTGPNATAHVTQTNSAAPPQSDILAALQSIRDAIVAAQAGDATKHADELGAVEALTVEARKDKPNKITVPALINGLGGTARLLAYAPKAIETLNNWGHYLASLMS